MIYRGTVRDGVVVFPPEVHLPDGLDVTVQPVQSPPSPKNPATRQNALRNGVPVFPASNFQRAPDLEIVNQLRDEIS